MCNSRISSTTGTGNIGCPFFVAHSGTEIVCEGVIDGTRTLTRFPCSEDKTFHQTTYCEKCWKKCEIFCSISHFRWTDD